MIAETTSQDRVLPRRTPWKRVSLWGATFVIAAALCLHWGPSWLRTDPSVSRERLRTAVVEQGTLVRDIKVDGSVVASSFPTLYSPAEGQIHLATKPGESVDRGQTLAEIDAPTLVNRMRQEQSTLEALEADLDRSRIHRKAREVERNQEHALFQLRLDAARRAFQRANRSRELGLINDAEYEAAQDAMRLAEMELDHGVTRGKLEATRLGLEITNQEALLSRQTSVVEELQRKVQSLSIKSPVKGMVGNVAVDERDQVLEHQALITVIDLSSLEVEIQIPEAYADDLTEYVLAEIQVQGTIHTGHVSHVAPEVRHSVVRGVVSFEAEPPQGLRQNQRVPTRLILAQYPHALKVSRGPFLEQFGGNKIYRVDGNQAILTPITLGAFSISEVQVLSGLHPGDEVVISDMSLLEQAPTLSIRP